VGNVLAQTSVIVLYSTIAIALGYNSGQLPIARTRKRKIKEVTLLDFKSMGVDSTKTFYSTEKY
jgi:hypothetical protein